MNESSLKNVKLFKNNKKRSMIINKQIQDFSKAKRINLYINTTCISTGRPFGGLVC